MDVDRIPESVVQVYLSADKGLFTNGQYPLKLTAKTFTYLIDFVAVDLKRSMVWLVEVTRAANPKDIVDKVHSLVENEAAIRRELYEESGIGSDFGLGIWLFLRGDACSAAKKMIGEVPLKLEITPIEDAIRSWAWLEPNGLTRKVSGAIGGIAAD